MLDETTHESALTDKRPYARPSVLDRLTVCTLSEIAMPPVVDDENDMSDAAQNSYTPFVSIRTFRVSFMAPTTRTAGGSAPPATYPRHVALSLSCALTSPNRAALRLISFSSTSVFQSPGEVV